MDLLKVKFSVENIISGIRQKIINQWFIYRINEIPQIAEKEADSTDE